MRERKDTLIVHPLTPQRTPEAISLAYEIFPESRTMISDPGEVMRASLRPVRYSEQLKEMRLDTIKFWFGIQAKQKPPDMVGITGLEHIKEDEPGIGWISWFGIAPRARGKGYGQQLLHTTEELARQTGYSKLRLWTTTLPNESAAQNMYEESGYPIFMVHDFIGGPKYQILYREKNLTEKN